jgi:hypothetical protein
VEKGYDPVTKENKTGIPEWPLVIQDIVVDTHNPDDDTDTCRLKYDRKPGGGSVLMRAQASRSPACMQKLCMHDCPNQRSSWCGSSTHPGTAPGLTLSRLSR